MKKKQFFRNFMTIMLFGAVGTLISFAVISLGNLSSLKLLVFLYGKSTCGHLRVEFLLKSLLKKSFKLKKGVKIIALY